MSIVLRFALLISLLLAGRASAEGYCRKLFHLGDEYTVCAVDPKKSTIRIHDLDSKGKPYSTFQALAKELWADRIFMRISMNGGMYQPDFSPVGLYIESGVEKQILNTNAGWGNFHLLPNGVFYLLPGSAGVMEAKAFATSGIRPLYATQSGPMLVIGGKIHPKFDPQSSSLKKRNGIGVAADGTVMFAISEGNVRFHDLATLFRDTLGCENALFLDGTISALYVPEWHRSDDAYPLGPIISVEIAIPPG
jgi:uncharacterized protein YigE (DUF2233 family)